MEATVVEGELSDLMKQMLAADSTQSKVWYVEKIQKAPYVTNPNEEADSQATYVGETLVTYVRIGSIVSATPDRFLVSDSFSPCVPVITFQENSYSLIHANGTFRVKALAAQPNANVSPTIIVRKARHLRQNEVATAWGKELKEEKGFKNVEFCDIPTQNMIGVIVYGQTRTILVYEQG